MTVSSSFFGSHSRFDRDIPSFWDARFSSLAPSPQNLPVKRPLAERFGHFFAIPPASWASRLATGPLVRDSLRPSKAGESRTSSIGDVEKVSDKSG